MPFPGQEARIVDVRTRQPIPDGVIGEIQVRGPNVFAGYWRNPQATAEAFDADGWFNTGDLGWRGADGYFVITGRARELIISGGYNIYPREVEEVLLDHPAVAEVAVVGLPDPEFGEQVVAVVVPTAQPRDGLEQELIDWCRARAWRVTKNRVGSFLLQRCRATHLARCKNIFCNSNFRRREASMHARCVQYGTSVAPSTPLAILNSLPGITGKDAPR
jgi:malonyl-CoA/methylmalonyl-CoA synthetase